MKQMTQVQKDVILLAIKQGGTVTPREARKAIPELDRRARAHSSKLFGNDNSPVWTVFRQLEEKVLLERAEGEWLRNSAGYREWSHIFRLVEGAK